MERAGVSLVAAILAAGCCFLTLAACSPSRPIEEPDVSVPGTPGSVVTPPGWVPTPAAIEVAMEGIVERHEALLADLRAAAEQRVGPLHWQAPALKNEPEACGVRIEQTAPLGRSLAEVRPDEFSAAMLEAAAKHGFSANARELFLGNGAQLVLAEDDETARVEIYLKGRVELRLLLPLAASQCSKPAQ